MKRIDTIPWISEGREVNGKYQFKCADRNGNALQSEKKVIFSLQFCSTLSKDLIWVHRLMVLIFLQDSVNENAIHCDAFERIWFDQPLDVTSSAEDWNARILWQLSIMKFFETQLPGKSCAILRK